MRGELGHAAAEPRHKDNMTIPKVLFGICPVCGGKGGDDPDPPDGFAPYRDAGNGLPLITYRGDVMCQLCRKERMAEDETKISDDAYREELNFLARAGFQTEIDS